MDGLGENLRKRADELGISNAEAARRAGLAERRYGNYVTGRNEPDLATLVRIAQVLKTSPNELLNFDGVTKTSSKGEILRDRIAAAVDVLGNTDRESIATFAEALVKKSR